jgi:hypothetical protein
MFPLYAGAEDNVLVTLKLVKTAGAPPPNFGSSWSFPEAAKAARSSKMPHLLDRTHGK